MPLPLIPIAIGVLIRAGLKKVAKTAIKQTVKKTAKPKAFRSARARSAEEQRVYLNTIKETKQLRTVKQDIRRTKKKIAVVKKMVEGSQKK